MGGQALCFRELDDIVLRFAQGCLRIIEKARFFYEAIHP